LVVQTNQKAREKGADYHPSFQQIAFVDSETGELQERRLEHPEAAEKFYRELAAQGKKVREVGLAEPSTRAKWRALRSARVSALKKCLTGTGIVREAMFQQRSELSADWEKPPRLPSKAIPRLPCPTQRGVGRAVDEHLHAGKGSI
jgi:hypothetical protein